MGKQYLYNVEITVDVDGYGESDAWNHHFGFRKIQSEIDSATGGRYIRYGKLGESGGLSIGKKREIFSADQNS